MNKLILLRHGQSQWNLENRFTGLKNVPLTEKGKTEAIIAGQILKKNNINIDIIFSSVLARANETAEITIKELKCKHLWNDDKLIMTCDKSLNERDYGDLVGLNKEETAKKYGNDQVHIWRRSFDIPPPGGESLKNVVDRVKPFFIKFIEPEISKEKNILIVAHGNSLRATMIQVGLYKTNEISNIEMPTGKPFVINYESNKIISSEFLI